MQPLQRENIRLAATVMLVRDDPSGLQVYMVKRPGRGDFPICMYFPAVKLIRKIGSLSFALIWRMPTPVPAWASALEDCVIG